MTQTSAFETILFFQRQPCYYKFFIENDEIIGEPQPHHYYNKTTYPAFTAKKSGDNWVVQGVEDADLRRQILLTLKNADEQHSLFQ